MSLSGATHTKDAAGGRGLALSLVGAAQQLESSGANLGGPRGEGDLVFAHRN